MQAPKRRDAPARSRTRLAAWALLAVAAGILGIYGITQLGKSGDEAAGQSGLQGSGDYVYAVGSPGRGEPAPPVKLSSTGGETFDLAAASGEQQVLLYFQEGLMCQPCWDQVVAIEREWPKFRQLGVGSLVTITGDPLDLLKQKVADEGIETPVLSDSTWAVSDSYDARSYGMMNGQTAGHSFVLVGKDARIRWRADYGGEPNYTMFVPANVLLQHLRRGVEQPA